MKRWLIGIVGVVAVLAFGGYVFREPLMNAMFERMTANMFVAKDDDPYDPGLAVGASVPALRARYQGQVVTDIGTVMGPRGLALFLNRSVDW
jgi:hypothetical protein